MTAQETAQNVLRRHFARLAQTISDPLIVATELFEKGIVSQSLLGRIRDVPGPNHDKNTLLLEAVYNQIAADADRFAAFLAILRKDVPLHPLVESMETMWGRPRDQHQNLQYPRGPPTPLESTSQIVDSPRGPPTSSAAIPGATTQTVPTTLMANSEVSLEVATTAPLVCTTSPPTANSQTSPPLLMPTTPTSEDRLQVVKKEISELECKFRKLAVGTGGYLLKQTSSAFLSEFRINLVHLPASQQEQHVRFFEEKRMDILNASSMEEIIFILGCYWNWWNYSLLQHLIDSFGNQRLKSELCSYLKNLEEFQKKTIVEDFVSASHSYLEVPPEFKEVRTRMEGSWAWYTVYQIRKLAQSFKLETILVGAHHSSIVLIWAVPSTAVHLLAATIDDNFLQSNGIESITIDGQDLQSHARQLLPESPSRPVNPRDLHKTDKIPPVPSWSSRMETHDRTVVVVGSSGSGITSVANNIIGLDKFELAGPTCELQRGMTKRMSHCDITVTSENKKYRIKMVNTVGLFDNITNERIMQDMKTYFKENLPEGVNLVLFVLRRGIFTDEEHKTFELLFNKFDKGFSHHSALVITHCEDLDDRRRKQTIDDICKNDLTKEIAAYMRKGIYTVGFPNPETTRPEMLRYYQPRTERDQETLRKLVYSCEEKKPTNELFTESRCSIS